MRISQVKIGEPYYYRGVRIIAEEIEALDRDKGIMSSGVICHLEKDKRRKLKAEARHMVPWDEQQKTRRVREADQQHAEQCLLQIQKLIGEGISPQGGVSREYAHLFLTETAAEKILDTCEAKPIPDNRRPSLVECDQEWIRRATLLGQRVRRALGVGHAGAYGGHTLFERGKKFQAQIFFCGDDLEMALRKLSNTKPESSSSLLELIG